MIIILGQDWQGWLALGILFSCLALVVGILLLLERRRREN